MAELRLIAAILVVLLAQMLEAEAGSSSEGKAGRGIWRSLCPWNCVSKPKQTESLGKDQVVHKSRYSVPKSRSIEMTKEHALKCLEPQYIAEKAQLLASDVEFIDDQFIADYWSEHPGEKNFMAIGSLEAGEAITKAMIRSNMAEDSLEKHLSVPCLEHCKSFGKLKWEVYDASELLGKDYSKLISSLDDKTQAAFFRYEICKHPDILAGANKEKQVESGLKSPPAKFSGGLLPVSVIEKANEHALERLKPGYIEKKVESLASQVKFIDDQLIADYWSEYPGEKNYTAIMGLRASKAIAKALIRDRENNIEGHEDIDQLSAHLHERLYRPCREFFRSFVRSRLEIYNACEILDKDFSKFISSLDDRTQAAFFRYELCNDILNRVNKKQIRWQVASDLKSLPGGHTFEETYFDTYDYMSSDFLDYGYGHRHEEKYDDTDQDIPGYGYGLMYQTYEDRRGA